MLLTSKILNAIESGSKIPIARHPNLSETLIILRGRLRVLINERY